MRPDDVDAARLYDMLSYAREVELMCRGVTFHEFQNDKKLRWATERCIEIIGEAARGVSRSFQASHPEVPWKAIVAQRHVLAHEYGEIRVERIFRVATIYVPALIPLLEPLLPEPPTDLS